MGMIVEISGRGQEISVITSDGQEIEGYVVRGIPEGEKADGGIVFDLDVPFTLSMDDGDLVRVTSPWACRIAYLDQE